MKGLKIKNYWSPEQGEQYWYVDENGEYKQRIFDEDDYEFDMYNICEGNCFMDKEGALLFNVLSAKVKAYNASNEDDDKNARLIRFMKMVEKDKQSELQLNYYGISLSEHMDTSSKYINKWSAGVNDTELMEFFNFINSRSSYRRILKEICSSYNVLYKHKEEELTNKMRAAFLKEGFDYKADPLYDEID